VFHLARQLLYLTNFYDGNHALICFSNDPSFVECVAALMARKIIATALHAARCARYLADATLALLLGKHGG
jgi:hypothetical protein